MFDRRHPRTSPDIPALALVLYPALRDSIEVAGAVRSEVLEGLSEEGAAAGLHRIFEAARSAVPGDGEFSRKSFGGMLEAASEAAVDPVVRSVTESVYRNVLDVMCDIPAAAVNRAAADAFSGTFVNAATRLVRGTRPGIPLDTRMDHVEILNRIRRSSMMYPACRFTDPPGAGAARAAAPGNRSEVLARMAGMAGEDLGEAAYRGACDAASRITARAVSADGSGTALHAAIVAVFEGAIRDVPGTAFRKAAENVCRKLSRAARRMDDVQEAAVKRLATELLTTTATCQDGRSAAMEAARLAPAATGKMAAYGACVETFRVVYGVMAGGAYRTSTDRARFGSIYGEALESTDRMDNRTYPGSSAFDYPSDDPDREINIDAIETRVWLQYFAAAGRSVEDWMKEAADVDYMADAESPENAGLMRLYEATYGVAHHAAVREASSIVLERGRGS